MPTLQEFFADSPTSRSLFDHLVALLDSLGPFDMRITTSQIAFRRRIAFAWAWLPAKYLRGRGAPLVLSIALRRRDPLAALEAGGGTRPRAFHAPSGIAPAGWPGCRRPGNWPVERLGGWYEFSTHDC